MALYQALGTPIHAFKGNCTHPRDLGSPLNFRVRQLGLLHGGGLDGQEPTRERKRVTTPTRPSQRGMLCPAVRASTPSNGTENAAGQQGAQPHVRGAARNSCWNSNILPLTSRCKRNTWKIGSDHPRTLHQKRLGPRTCGRAFVAELPKVEQVPLQCSLFGQSTYLALHASFTSRAPSWVGS